MGKIDKTMFFVFTSFISFEKYSTIDVKQEKGFNTRIHTSLWILHLIEHNEKPYNNNGERTSIYLYTYLSVL